MSSCSYELATVDELCLDCEKVVVAKDGAALKASCSSEQVLVFVTEVGLFDIFL